MPDSVETPHASSSAGKDALAEAVGRMPAELASPALADALTMWLARQFLADQFARLEQAGHTSDGRIPLARVFIDLPAQSAGGGYDHEQPEAEPASDAPLPPGVLAEILAYRPDAVSREPYAEPPLAGMDAPRATRDEVPGRVLIGGPGQGKSTCSQYVCQLHRAALLHPRLDQLDERTRALILAFEQQRRGDALGEDPTFPMFPIRVVLSNVADALAPEASGTAPSFLGYLLNHLRRDAGANVAVEALRAFLITAPWLLVLDGLDEVPHGPPRVAVMKALRTFIDDLRDAGARGFVIGTTRPQGYRDELGWLSPRYLVPLSQRRALHYAERLCALRFADEPDRRAHVLATLQKASTEGQTARLLRTPLQVTMMTTLVDQGGQPPRERWRLFHEYYRIFYAREMERPIPAATLLRELRPQIDAIHRHVGLLLQAESELARGARSQMTRARFEELVDARLAAEDFDDATRAERTQQIVEAALDRLVFLVAVEAGQIGFEIRSLQELMASEALTSGPEAQVKARLSTIAASHTFRNVFLFAASKCFANPDFWHLRDHFVQICEELNDGAFGELYRVSRLGSELASDLLEEGVAREAPKHRRRLADIALRVLDIPPHERQDRVAKVLSPWAADQIREAIEARLSLAEPADRLSGWRMLLTCIQEGAVWASELGDAHWPAGVAEQEDLFRVMLKPPAGATRWLAEKLDRFSHRVSPRKMEASGIWQFAIVDRSARGGWFRAKIRALLRTGAPPLPVWSIDPSRRLPTSLLIVPARPNTADKALARFMERASLEDVSKTWRARIADSVFLAAPSAETLALALERLAAHPRTYRLQGNKDHLSWPFYGCLRMARDASGLAVIAGRLRRGELGDITDWLAAEDRWMSSLSLEALTQGLPWPDDPNPATALPPVFVMGADFAPGRTFDLPIWISVWEAYRAARSPMLRATLAELCLTLLANADSVPLGLAELEELMRHAAGSIPLRVVLASGGTQVPVDLLRQLEDAKRLGRHDVDDFMGLVRALSPTLSRSDLPDMLVNVLYAASNRDGRPFPRALLPVLERVSAVREALARLQWRFEIGEAYSLACRLATALESASAEEVRLVAFGNIAGSAADASARIELELTLAAHLSERHWQLRSALSVFSRWYWAQPGVLTDAQSWSSLGLPTPAPSAARKSEPPSSPGGARIASITLTGLRPFERATISPPTDRAGNWLVLLGENGVGKSTLLRAVALALTHPDVAKAMLVGTGAPYVRAGHQAAEVVAQIDGNIFRARIDEHDGAETVATFSAGNARRPLVFAYGCRRGSALGGADREVDFPLISDVATLFDEGASLIHAETWLKQLRLDAALNPGTDKETRYQTVIAALLSVLPGVTSIDVRADRVWFEGPRVGRAPLAALSDGYLTTIGWVVDMIARWLHHATRLKLPVAPNFLETMTGLVLIDEIDLHLHPSWQISVIDEVRRRFPRMSFIVTTHNPLTLLGAKPGEIFVLRRADDGGHADTPDAPVEVVQMDIPPGLRADQVLTGAWFGLASTLDPDTLALLDRHRRMLADNVPAFSEERQSVEAELRKRLGGFGDTSLERLAQSVAAEVLGPDARALTPEERSKLREKVKARVAARDRSRQGSKP